MHICIAMKIMLNAELEIRYMGLIIKSNKIVEKENLKLTYMYLKLMVVSIFPRIIFVRGAVIFKKMLLHVVAVGSYPSEWRRCVQGVWPVLQGHGHPRS